MSFIVASFDERDVFFASGSFVEVLNLENEDDSTLKRVIDWSAVKEELIRKPQSSEDNDEKEKVPKKKTVDEIVILCISHSNGPKKLMAIGTNEKLIHVFELSDDENQSGTHVLSVVVPKAPTSCVFDKDDTHVIFGDRSGDVHRFSVKDGSLNELAGAISMVLDVRMTADGKRLLMADRDEKLRAIRYPETYVIDTFFLGHTEYVRTIANSGNKKVWTAGGDCTIKQWNIESGDCLKTIEVEDIFDDVESKKPIRKLALSDDETKLVVAVEKELFLYIVDTGSYEVTKIETDSKAEIVDVIPLGNSFVVLSRSEILILDQSGEISRRVQPSSDLATSLSTVNDAVDNLFKNVTHNNQQEYEKRKIEKFAKIEEKKTKSLKRKADDVEADQ